MPTCLGMATDGLEEPLHAKGVEVVYGYSQIASVGWEFNVETAFWSEIKNGKTVSDAAQNMKEKCGVHDVLPWVTIPAYPIFVSSKDEYPGKGDVDAEQEVHSEWTLYPSAHEHEWSFMGFKWERLNGSYAAFAMYKCPGCGMERGVEAIVTKIQTTLPQYKATINAEVSLDGQEHMETKRMTKSDAVVQNGLKKELKPVKPLDPKPITPRLP